MVLVFLFLALFFATFYGIKGDDIYGTAKDKKISWPVRWDSYIQRFFGVFFGWMIMWWLLEKQLDVFCHHHPVVPVELIHVVVFVVSLIGIFGRLPQLVHNLITLFGFGKK